MCGLNGTPVKFNDYPGGMQKLLKPDSLTTANTKIEIDETYVKPASADQLKFINFKESKSDVLNSLNLVEPWELESEIIVDTVNQAMSPKFDSATINLEDLEKNLTGKSFKDQFKIINDFVKITHTPLNVIQENFLQKPFKNISKIIEAIKFNDFTAVKSLKPAQLADDLEAQIRLALLARDSNKDVIKELSEALHIPAESITGTPKKIDRILDKMLKGKKELGDIGDITRARASFDKLDASMIDNIETKFREILENKYGKENVTWKSSLGETTKDYRGRVNIGIKLESGMKFEFQMGTSQISTLYGTKFNLLNNKTTTNFHDVFYKGVDYYTMSPQNEKFLANVGGGDIETGRSIFASYRNSAISGKDVRGMEQANKYLKEYGMAARDFGSTFTKYNYSPPADFLLKRQALNKLGPYNTKKDSELFSLGEKMIKKGLEQIGEGDVNKGLKELADLKSTYSAMLDKVTKMSNDGILLVNIKDPQLNSVQLKEFQELIKKGKAVDFTEFVKANGNVIEGLDKVFNKINYNVYLPKLFQKTAYKSALAEDTAPLIKKSLGEIKVLAEKTKLDQESVNVLEKLASDPNFLKADIAFKNLLSTVEAATKDDPRIFKGFIETLRSGNPETLAFSFKSEKAGEDILKVGRNILPIMEKLGIKEASTITAKIGSGLSKVLPVIGGLASGFDAVRLTDIALSGNDFTDDLNYIKYPAGDPRDTPENNAKLKDLRVLALIGAQLNGADTLWAALEFSGSGRINLPAQLALCAAEIAIDLSLYHFHEHPEQMPDKMSKFIKAAAFGMLATGGVNPAAAASVYSIYGIDSNSDMGAEFSKSIKEGGLSDMKFFTDLEAKIPKYSNEFPAD
jgi:hypothetical protein